MTRPFIPLAPGARAARWASLGLALTLLSACSVTPPHQRPEMPVPATFKEAGATWAPAAPADALDRGPWWELFGDAELNRLAYSHPIYVGKAVPKGWRQSRISDSAATQSKELHTRLKEHSRNISTGSDLSLQDFSCRFVIFEQEGSDMISTIEAALIKLNRPLWNTALDGFGNHDPGSGRYEQAKSDWDVIHAGRLWAEKCKGHSKDASVILAHVERHLKGMG